MTDEKFVFVSDVREKKQTASGAFHKRTHAGKGGAVKFPSDFMTKKELKAMSGEAVSYRLNDPMKWNEFKYMPDDIKVIYIKNIREKFRVPDTKIFEMLGISQQGGSNAFKKLGLSLGKGNKMKNFDSDAWFKWVNGIPAPQPVTSCEDLIESDESSKEPFAEVNLSNRVTHDIETLHDFAKKNRLPVDVVPVSFMTKVLAANTEQLKEIPVVPLSGAMTFDGKFKAIFKALERILDDSNVRLNVSWEIVPEDRELRDSDG